MCVSVFVCSVWCLYLCLFCGLFGFKFVLCLVVFTCECLCNVWCVYVLDVCMGVFVVCVCVFVWVCVGGLLCVCWFVCVYLCVVRFVNV